MSARRVAWLLVAGLAVIVFAIWLSSRRHLERDLAAGALVLPGLEQSVNSVTTVTLRKGDGSQATMQKDVSVWRVAERGWSADVSKVRKLLLDLGALNIVEEKTRLPANYPQLGVEDVSSPKATGTRVDVAAPSHTWSIIIGKSSGGKSGYVRVATAPQTLLAAPLLMVDSDPKAWLDRTLLDVPVARVREVENAAASIVEVTKHVNAAYYPIRDIARAGVELTSGRHDRENLFNGALRRLHVLEDVECEDRIEARVADCGGPIAVEVRRNMAEMQMISDAPDLCLVHRYILIDYNSIDTSVRMGEAHRAGVTATKTEQLRSGRQW